MDSLKKLPAMLAGHDVTYVVKVWDKRGTPPRRQVERQRANLPELVGLLAGPNAVTNGLLLEVYDAVIFSLPFEEIELPVTESCFNFLPEDARHIEIRGEEELLADMLPYRHRVNNNLRMWYLIDRADAKRQQLAQDFDIVIRMRPDTLLPDNFGHTLEQIHGDVAAGAVYVDTMLPNLVGDQVFVARPDKMTLLTRYYRDFRYPKYCANVFCFPHEDLHDYCVKMGLPYKSLPVIDKQTASRTRLTAVSLEPFIGLARVMELLGAVRTVTPVFDDLRTLLQLHIAVIDSPDASVADLRHANDTLKTESFAADMQFTVFWMKYRIARRLGEQSAALKHLCDAHTAAFETGGEELFRQIIEIEGWHCLAEGQLDPPTLLEHMPASAYRALGSMYLEANKLHEARTMLQAGAEECKINGTLLEKLAYVHSRLSQWHDVLQVAKIAAQKSLMSPLLERLQARATEAVSATEKQSA